MNDEQDSAFLAEAGDHTFPKHLPQEWRPIFLQMTGEDGAHSWGLKAAIAIARHRKTHHIGPTFAELFDELFSLPVDPHRAITTPPRHLRAATYRYRHHVAVHWRRLGWIDWNHAPRSLRTGRAFRAASSAWAKSRLR